MEHFAWFVIMGPIIFLLAKVTREKKTLIVVGNLLKSLDHLQIVKSDWLNIMLLRHYTTHNFMEWATTRSESEDEPCGFQSNETKNME